MGLKILALSELCVGEPGPDAVGGAVKWLESP